MKYSSFPVVALLAFAIAFTGCKKQEQCASGDTPEVCKGVVVNVPIEEDPREWYKLFERD